MDFSLDTRSKQATQSALGFPGGRPRIGTHSDRRWAGGVLKVTLGFGQRRLLDLGQGGSGFGGSGVLRCHGPESNLCG